MDNTSRDAKAARAAGMSYGKWKILHPETAPKKVEKKKLYHRVCPGCATKFDTDRADKVYCNPDCARLYNYRKYHARKRAEQNAMSKV